MKEMSRGTNEWGRNPHLGTKRSDLGRMAAPETVYPTQFKTPLKHTFGPEWPIVCFNGFTSAERRNRCPGGSTHYVRSVPPIVSCVLFSSLSRQASLPAFVLQKNLYPTGPSHYMCPWVDTPPDTCSSSPPQTMAQVPCLNGAGMRPRWRRCKNSVDSCATESSFYMLEMHYCWSRCRHKKSTGAIFSWYRRHNICHFFRMSPSIQSQVQAGSL